MTTVKKVEVIPNWGLAQEEVRTEEKYDCHSSRRAWIPFSGYVFIKKGEALSYYHDNGRSVGFYANVVRNLKSSGYAISRRLQHLAQQEERDIKASADKAQRHLSECKSLAATLGRPVVVESHSYMTTASVGRNYRLAMPDGEVIVVRNGSPRGSHSGKGGTTNPDQAVQAAIAAYHS